MKFTLLAIVILASTSVMAKEVRNFNKLLMEEVQKDIRNDNAEDLKTKTSATRGPASVSTEVGPTQDESKIDKTVRQTGSRKW